MKRFTIWATGNEGYGWAILIPTQPTGIEHFGIEPTEMQARSKATAAGMTLGPAEDYHVTVGGATCPDFGERLEFETLNSALPIFTPNSPRQAANHSVPARLVCAAEVVRMWWAFFHLAQLGSGR